MNAGQALCTAFSMSGCCRLICPRLWALSRWLMYSWQQAHPLAWWMAILSGHPLIFQAAPWHAAIKVSVSKVTIAEVCPNTGVGMTELVSIWTCVSGDDLFFAPKLSRNFANSNLRYLQHSSDSNHLLVLEMLWSTSYSKPLPTVPNTTTCSCNNLILVYMQWKLEV